MVEIGTLKHGDEFRLNGRLGTVWIHYTKTPPSHDVTVILQGSPAVEKQVRLGLLVEPTGRRSIHAR